MEEKYLSEKMDKLTKRLARIERERAKLENELFVLSSLASMLPKPRKLEPPH